MDIQKRLLLEEIELLKNSELGRRVMRGAMPRTVEEFREQVPLTTYSDYLPELVEKREDVLPTKPAVWVHNIGWPGRYQVKQMPLSERFLHEFERVAAGVGLIATCGSQGDFPLREHMKGLLTMGSRYYGLGLMAYLLQRALGYDILPSDGEEISFQERMKVGFRKALSQGLDGCGGLPSVLAYVGEIFKQGAMGIDTRFLLSHPKAAVRLTRGLIKSKLAHRPMLPKDLWSLKAIIIGGVDSTVFGKWVEELWGRKPLEIYAGTEGGIYATQTWDYEGMTFIPNLNFLEFIPEGEWFKWQLDHSYQPKTVLLDEVKAGEKYEIVITNFHGGIMIRYRPGDMVRITSLRNEKLNLDIPQMVFEKRVDELIIMFGVGHLTEKLIGEAIENTGIPYVDWTARKEVIDGKPVLNIYLELGDNYIASEQSVAASVYNELEKLDSIYHFNLQKYVYGDAISFLGLRPIAVTFLPRGAFSSYISQQRSEGATGSNLKPPHINPSDEVLSLLRAPKLAEAVPVTEAERATAR
ncbi:MAG: GH3 auxin-responsive promoter family protein, partial [Chloroflexi bacterium]|nr:GH3 auxin-responsive promoter family protein [Chloroflexota bacterium]